MSFVEILILYNEQEKNIKKYVDELEIELKKIKINKNKFSINKNDIENLRINNLVLIIANDVEGIIRDTRLLQKSIKDIPIFILTGNLNKSNLIFAMQITKYISYVKNDPKKIVLKIKEILKKH